MANPLTYLNNIDELINIDIFSEENLTIVHLIFVEDRVDCFLRVGAKFG